MQNQTKIVSIKNSGSEEKVSNMTVPQSVSPINPTNKIRGIIPKTDVAFSFSDQKKCPIMHGNIIPEE
jgi:hypothetical protein